MYTRIFCCILILTFAPIMGVHAALDLSFSDTNPPSPLKNEVLPVGGNFSIDVIASAPTGTVAAVEFNVIWTPAGNVEYVEVSAGDFIPDATIFEGPKGAPGIQKVAVTTGTGKNTVPSGVLLTLRFTKKTGDGSVKFDFSGITALDLALNAVTPVNGVPSSDISLPVTFSSLSADVNESGVTLKWRTIHEIDNAGFNVLRAASEDGEYVKLNPALIKGQGTSAIPHDYQYVDSGVTEGNIYYYKVEALDLQGDISLSKAIKVEVSRDKLKPPKRSELGQNYPNPGNPETWIPYVLSSDSDVRVEVYNMAGQLIRILDLGHREPGTYTSKDRAVYWDGRSSSGEEVPSGIYFYTIRAGSFAATRKLFMLK